jgi:hypothetical protein
MLRNLYKFSTFNVLIQKGKIYKGTYMVSGLVVYNCKGIPECS